MPLPRPMLHLSLSSFPLPPRRKIRPCLPTSRCLLPAPLPRSLRTRESAAEASTSEAGEAGAAPSEPAPDAALENTLRHLPLDELLRDIHDL